MSDQDYFDSQTITKPAVGTDAIRIIPGDTFEMLVMAHCTLTTSAAVATRVPVLRYTSPDGVTYMQHMHNLTVAASTTVDLSWGQSVDTQAVANTGPGQASLVPAVLQSGWKFQVTAVNKDAGDQFSAVALWLRRYPTGPWVPSYGAMPYLDNQIVGVIGG